jgi:hypothetical protein
MQTSKKFRALTSLLTPTEAQALKSLRDSKEDRKRMRLKLFPFLALGTLFSVEKVTPLKQKSLYTQKSLKILRVL